MDATTSQTNFNSISPSLTNNQVKHEILHALGFSAGLFAFYRDDDGLPLTPRLQVDNKPFYNETLRLLV